jgi:glutamate carboxypeptidase
VTKSTAQRILQTLSERRDEMVDLLTRCAQLESPSQVPESQQPVIELLATKLNDVGFRCRRLAGRTSGGQLLAVPREHQRGTPKQLLLGHCDTVWPTGTLEKMPVQSRDGCLHGPGVYDMKGGLVQAIFAIQALRELRLTPQVTPVFFINSDEEIGSSESASHIVRLAKIVNRAFVMEPSLGPEGQLKTARKGVGRFVIRVLGKAAHAGLDPEKGISAILELSHVVQTLFALNDPERGTTVNVGTIDGGMRPNVIAPESRAVVDVRVRTQRDADAIYQTIYAIQPTVPGTELEISGHIGRPPLERTPRNRVLWQHANDAAESLGFDIAEGAAGGGSDGNWTSLHTATLDGLGAVGDGAHALTEHVVQEMMPSRAALLACLMLREPVTTDATSIQLPHGAITDD